VRSSVIIYDLDIERVAVFPPETNPPLVVDANTMLARAVALEFLQTVAGWHPEVDQLFGGVDEPELAQDGAVELRRESADWFTPEQPLGILISEALDHCV
jgi:hypothetical protein